MSFQYKKLAICLAWCLIHATYSGHISAAMVDRTVYGVEIGAPLALPECPYDSRYMSAEYLDKTSSSDRPCYKFPRTWNRKPGGALKVDNDVVLIDVYMAPVIEAHLINGNVEKINIETSGNLDQSGQYLRLLKKYGQPSVFERNQLTNSYGVTVEAIEAAWQFDNFRVIFNGINGRMNSGDITIKTNVFIKHEHDELEAAKARTPKM